MNFQIERITIAITDMDNMVRFYNIVFDADLTSFEPFDGMTFYRGSIGAIPVIFCPNELPQVDARQNRQQFHFVVEDVAVIMQRVRDGGGQLLGEMQADDTQKSASAQDPDGNTMEFIEHLTG